MRDIDVSNSRVPVQIIKLLATHNVTQVRDTLTNATTDNDMGVCEAAEKTLSSFEMDDEGEELLWYRSAINSIIRFYLRRGKAYFKDRNGSEGNKIRRIGYEFYKRGGDSMIKAARSEFGQRCYVTNCSHDLEMIWDRIGPFDFEAFVSKLG